MLKELSCTLILPYMITRLGICGLEIYLGILGMGDSLAELKTFMLDILIITLHTYTLSPQEYLLGKRDVLIEDWCTSDHNKSKLGKIGIWMVSDPL